ncbi:MAG: 23S rRNA (pseudouridine(1915)-N(3))-methyltransferase RlmH [Gammaproteobacteria bacterium]
MKIYLITIGQSLPKWIQEGYHEYAKRMPPECTLELIELPGVKRTKGYPVAKIIAEESEQLKKAIPKNCHVVALDEHGTLWDTMKLSQQLVQWQQQGQNMALLVGGADGLAEDCKRLAQQLWSLSPLTLPHGLVRIVVAEQLYRAWSVLNCHPYHRA